MTVVKNSRSHTNRTTDHQRRTERRKAAGSAAAAQRDDGEAGRPGGGQSLRTRLERSSLPLVRRLHRLPKLVVPLLMVGLLAAGILLHNLVGLACLVVMDLFMVWLTYLAWPALRRPLQRLVRMGLLGALVAFTVLQGLELAGVAVG